MPVDEIEQTNTGLDVTEEQESADPVIDDFSERRDGMDRELLAGPIQDLCEYFGLSAKAIVVIQRLGCTSGLDLPAISMNKVHLFVGEKSARRIGLLREWAQLRMKELAAAAGPSGKSGQNELNNVSKKEKQEGG